MPVFQGTRYTRNFRMTSCSTGLPVDISGWKFRSMIRDNRDDLAPLVELTTDNGGWLVVNAEEGRMQMTLSPMQTSSLPVGRMMMDVERVDLVDPIWLFEVTFQSKTPITRD